jgi:hypothetical protein
VLTLEGEPLEFGYRGRRFHIHAVISRWRESGGWWNRIDGGTEKSTSMTAAGGSEEFRILDFLDDGARTIWRVEAAPVGALATFEIELDEATGQWQIRPTSRPA